jgi:N-methylhydantoinase A
LASAPKGHAQPRGPLDIIHGTTIGTNCFLERRGARVALITTAGFEDLIEIGRQARPRLYDLNVRREPPLVPRTLRFAVKERTAADGKVLLRPSPAELRRRLKQVKHSGAESLALCFLFSFANPANEQAVARALRELGVPISVSHDILPEFREYERLSTVVINAYLAPRMGTYLAQLEQQGEGPCGPPLSRLQARDKGRRDVKTLPPENGSGHVYVMQSSGGITTAERAGREPVRTILSGPAGGVVATTWLAEQFKIPRAISDGRGATAFCLLAEYQRAPRLFLCRLRRPRPRSGDGRPYARPPRVDAHVRGGCDCRS